MHAGARRREGRLAAERAWRAESVGRGRAGLQRAAADVIQGRRRAGYRRDSSGPPTAVPIVYVRGGDLEHIGASKSQSAKPREDAGAGDLGRFRSRAARRRRSPMAIRRLSRKTATSRSCASGQIWMTIDRSATSRPRWCTSGRFRANLRWSPDGSALAFVSQRAETRIRSAFINRATNRSSIWIRAPIATAIRCGASTAGALLLFVRRASRARAAQAGARSADAVVDSHCRRFHGAGSEVWHADPGPGSPLHAMVADGSDLVGRWRSLAFSVGKDWLAASVFGVGRRRVRRRQLTPGDFEIEHVSLQPRPARAAVFVEPGRHRPPAHLAGPGGRRNSGADSEARRGDRMGAGGCRQRRGRLFRGPAPRDIGRARQSSRQSARQTIWRPNSIPADFPRSEEVVPQQVIFPASDGMQIHGQLFLPKNGAGKHPAIDLLPRRVAAPDAARMALRCITTRTPTA